MLGSPLRGPAVGLIPPPYAPAGPRRQSRAGAGLGQGRGPTGLVAFAIDRNFCHFLWYGGVAGEGLRSVGAGGELPNQERVLYPAHRPPSTGRDAPRETRGASRPSRVSQKRAVRRVRSTMRPAPAVPKVGFEVELEVERTPCAWSPCSSPSSPYGPRRGR